MCGHILRLRNIIKFCIAIVFILQCHYVAFPETFGEVKFERDGSFIIQSPGISRITGGLFLWYDGWKYATPANVTSVGQNMWKGSMPAEGVANGYICYSQVVTPRNDNGVNISLEFQKGGEIQLDRGIFMLIQFPRELTGSTLVFTHGSLYLSSDNYRTVARGFSIDLSTTTSMTFMVDRACIFEHRGEPGEAMMNIRLTSKANDKVNIDITFGPATNVSVPWMETHESKLSLGDVQLSSDKVKRCQILEMNIQLTGTYYNYFDPDDISVEAEFTTPSKRKVTMPAFIYQGFNSEQEEDLELLSRQGDPFWKVRFAPTEVGTYSVVIVAKDRSGSIRSRVYNFECIESDSKGFVTVSKTSDPKYLQFENGELFFLIGHNMPTYHHNIEEYMIKMKEAGENYTRLWMYSSALGIEWAQPVGYYRLDEAWKLDKAIELALKHGIYLMLCLDTHQDFREHWAHNPYNIKQGGPCRTPLSFFTDPNAKALYKKRLRYIVARWSAYSNIIAWEFLNQVEGWEGAEKNRSAIVKWHSEMAKTLRKLDPYGHLITTSFWTTPGWQEIWNLPEIDIVQTHYYANEYRDMADEVAKICAQKRLSYPNKPHLFAEYGMFSEGETVKNDPEGIHLHNGNWSALMSGAASVPASWWHETYIDAGNLYRVFTGLAKFLSEEKELSRHPWTSIRAELSYVVPPEHVTYSDLSFSGADENNWKPLKRSTFVVKDDGSVDGIDLLPKLLHGKVHKNLKTSIVFKVDFPVQGKFVMHIGRVGARGLLKVYIDGTLISSFELPTGKGLGSHSEFVTQWKRWETTYDKDFEVNVDAGKHEIKIENDGEDWITIEHFKLTNYLTNMRPNLRVLGMQSSDKALIWIQNKSHTWANVIKNVQIKPVERTILFLQGFQDGVYLVELWDTYDGQITEQREIKASENGLTIPLPQIEKDIALKIKRTQ